MLATVVVSYRLLTNYFMTLDLVTIETPIHVGYSVFAENACLIQLTATGMVYSLVVTSQHCHCLHCMRWRCLRFGVDAYFHSLIHCSYDVGDGIVVDN